MVMRSTTTRKRRTYRCIDANGDEHFRQTETRHYEYAILIRHKASGKSWVVSWSSRKDLADKEARRYMNAEREVRVVPAELVHG